MCLCACCLWACYLGKIINDHNQPGGGIFPGTTGILSPYIIPKGDYAVSDEQKKHLYLVIERQQQGIFLARLAPDLMRLELLAEEPAKGARAFIYRQLKQAGVVHF